jgi:hypothetical protein
VACAIMAMIPARPREAVVHCSGVEKLGDPRSSGFGIYAWQQSREWVSELIHQCVSQSLNVSVSLQRHAYKP